MLRTQDLSIFQASMYKVIYVLQSTEYLVRKFIIVSFFYSDQYSYNDD